MSRPDLAIVFPRAGAGGGVERVALDLLRFEAARRDTRFVGVELDDPDLPHVAVPMPRVPAALRPLAFRRASARVLADLAPRVTVSFGADCPPGDIYWVQSVHAAWLAEGGEVFLRGRRVPAIVRRMLLRHQVLLRMERRYFTDPRPRAILCTSQREIDDLVRFYGVDRERMHLAPNGFDGTVFNPQRRTELRDAARERIAADNDDVVVLMVANEWHRKGLGVLLRAVAEAGDRRLRVDLVGMRSPIDYEPLARSLGVRMHWHGPSKDVAPFYAAADAFALPTVYEPFGLVIVEAMAMGLPVIVSRLAGASTAVQHGTNGLLLDDPTDVGALAIALRRYGDPDERRRVGDTAGVTVDPYEWTAVLGRVDELIFGSSVG